MNESSNGGEPRRGPSNYCPYCQTQLNRFVKSIEVEFEIPITPPPGAKNLDLKSIRKGYQQMIYAICPTCEAKYAAQGDYWSSVNDIPDDKTFCDNFLKSKLSHFGLDTKYKILELNTVTVPNTVPKSKSNCFIATAIYGQDSIEVKNFQRFRDLVLLKHALGKNFISFYYSVSPYVLSYIDRKRSLRIFIRKIALDPIFFLVFCINKKLEK